MTKRDPKDPDGEYDRYGYYLAASDLSEDAHKFCAEECIVVDNCLQNYPETITDQVIEVIHQREKKGRQKYGHPIDPFDGRDWLEEAIEECADMLQYLVTFREKLRRNDPNG